MNGPQGAFQLRADHITACTGFRFDIDQIDYLDLVVRKDIARESGGIAALDSQFETSASGLFIIGIPSVPGFEPFIRFMYGAKHAALVLARRLALMGAIGAELERAEIVLIFKGLS
jgi:hypothetical protein